MAGNFLLLTVLLIFIFAGRFVIRKMNGVPRDALFALLNIGCFYGIFYYNSDQVQSSHVFTRMFPVYLALVVVQFATMRLFAEKEGWLPWVAFFTPILALIVVRYGTPLFFKTLRMPYPITPYFIGISYLAFRCSRLVLEVRNGTVKPPGFLRYASFCFFVPTMSVGPINSYSNYQRAFDDEPPDFPICRAALRILVGAIKYRFLGSVFFQLSYGGLLQDDHYHHWIDLPVAMLSYYLFLYCNFSGFCDMAIGAAGLVGVPVPENFADPFGARNVKVFWNRWHITLSQYFRDVVFAPLSKFLVSVLGPKRVNHAIAMTIVVVFLLIGIWHGVGWNYAAFGAAHAVGLVANHYYTVGLKSSLGAERFKAYNANPWIHAVAVVTTFCYCGATLFLFANTFPEMKDIFSTLR
jgi:D-alanyl-lipoteichoic acid acyltransferase DltB (MBOAT superfamily)